MLVEFFQHLMQPMPRWAKQMGYGREAVSLIARHRRRRAAWAPHLSACRDLIARAAADCPARGRAVVLGSGALLDVPVADLAARFRRVDLVDLVHPPEARRRAEALDNVTLVSADISGAAHAVYMQAVTAEPVDDRPAAPIGLRNASCRVIAENLRKAVKMGGRPAALPEPRPDPALIEGADFVVSANILAQLPLLLLDWLDAHRPFAAAAPRDAFARSVVDRHLALLRNHSGRVVLISEVLRLIEHDGGGVEKIDPLFGAPVPWTGEEWTWDVAPQGEINRRLAMRLNVLGIPDLAKAPQSRSRRNATLAAP